jgi:hypothetical protein
MRNIWHLMGKEKLDVAKITQAKKLLLKKLQSELFFL